MTAKDGVFATRTPPGTTGNLMTDHQVPGISDSLLGGRYRVGPVIGLGGMGTVYRAGDEVLGREVALKVYRPDPVDPERLRWHQEEIATLARLNHPGLVTLYDAGSSPFDGGSVSWLVMELIPGVDLGRYLDAGPLDHLETVRLGAELASALHYIHRRNIVHRDVKPGNIVMARYFDDEAPHPKLADFGIARMINGTPLASSGTTLGTAGYLSPEQVTGAAVGAPSDVYSLGLVLLQCLTGELEYPGPPLASARARLARPPRIPGSLGPDLAGLLEAMTATDPRHRPVAVEAAQALRTISGSEAPAAAARAGSGAVAAAMPSATPRLGLEPPTAHISLPVLKTSQMTNATQGLPWRNPPERPPRQPAPVDGLDRPAQSGSAVARTRGKRKPPKLQLGLAAAALLLFVAALVFGAVIATSRWSEPAQPPTPSVPAELDEHLQQLEESLTP
jgi:serine/threonine protein kinase